uniref:Uncharacterized protein n=1 Tax=Romanomermis culicivorax TaxID=13658 RepID=A0A915ITP2_ROMCU
MPCIDKQSASLDKACDSKCNSYSKSFNDLDKIDLTDLSNEKLTDMEKMFNDSCKFMTCQKDCEKSLILKSCSKEGADFTEKLYSSLFSMIGGFVNMINIVRDENSTIVITTNCFHND